MSAEAHAIPDDIRMRAYKLGEEIRHHVAHSEIELIQCDASMDDMLAKAINDAVMAERERCARLMEDDGEWTFAGDPAAMAIFEDVRELAADAIRAAPKAEEA